MTGLRPPRRLRRGVAMCLALIPLLGGVAHAHEVLIAVAVDRDDSDDDGTTDSEQASGVPTHDAAELVVASGDGKPVTVNVLGGLRVSRQGKAVATPFTLQPDELPAPL